MDQNDFHSPDVEDNTFHDHQNDNEKDTSEPDTTNTPKQEKEETHRLNVAIPKDVAKVAKQASFFLEMNLADYVAEALEVKNEQAKEKAREALL